MGNPSFDVAIRRLKMIMTFSSSPTLDLQDATPQVPMSGVSPGAIDLLLL